MKMKWNKSKKSKKITRLKKQQKEKEASKGVRAEMAQKKCFLSKMLQEIVRQLRSKKLKNKSKQTTKKQKISKQKKRKKPWTLKVAIRPSGVLLVLFILEGPETQWIPISLRWAADRVDIGATGIALVCSSDLRSELVDTEKGCCTACSTSRENPMEHTTCTVPLPVKWWSTITFCGRERFWSWFSFCVCVWFMFVRLRSVMWTSLWGQMDDRNESTLVVWEDNFGAALWEFPPPIT